MARSFAVKAVHKQMYPATHNFRDEVDGTSGTDIDFVDAIDANCAATIVAVIDGHRKVLYTDAVTVNYMGWQNDFVGDEATGTIEFWIRFVQANLQHSLSIGDGGTADRIVINWFNTGDVKYYDGVHRDTGANYAANIWYHYKIEFDCAADWHLWIDGVSIDGGAGYTYIGNPSAMDMMFFDPQIGAESYIDAVGYSWDTDYHIGDNVHWRNYFDQDSDFESEDVGTIDTDIDFVDAKGGDTVEITAEYDEHKKVLHMLGAGNRTYIQNTIVERTSGTIEFWARHNGWATHNMVIRFGTGYLLYFANNREVSWLEDGGAYPLIFTMTASTWHHFKITYDCVPAKDTINVWIDNVLYLDGAETNNNIASFTYFMIDINQLANVVNMSFDAISYDWTSGNEVADNRIFDYNDPYTRKDITTDIVNVLYKNALGKYREADIYAETSYESTEIFVQVYDCNSKLAMEAELKKRDQTTLGSAYIYVLMDKNRDDLDHESSNSFSAAAIHDPTDSTSMLKVVLPNVSEADGDLILVNTDTKADTYSPTTINYPDYKMLNDIGDLADSIVIIEANGKCHLDDDLASGTELDLDVEADKNKMTDSPLVSDVLVALNYFEVRGAINPDTGARWYKITDNTGDDKKRSWRITNNNFKSQADVDAYAAKLVTKSVPIRNITFWVQDVGAHDMGTTIKYDFVNAAYNVPEGNYYVIFEGIDFDKNKNTIVLSEGVIEESLYAAAYERETAYNDSYASGIYATDINTIQLVLNPIGGAAWGVTGVEMTAVNEGVDAYLTLSVKIDASRDIIIDFQHQNSTNVTVDGTLEIIRYDNDGGAGSNPVTGGAINWDYVITAFNGKKTSTYTIAAADAVAGQSYKIQYLNQEAAVTNSMIGIQVRYAIKREV